MDDESGMRVAIEAATGARLRAHPNPWVGALIEPGGFVGATESPGGRHAEAVALAQAAAVSADLRDATMYVTLEPCCLFEGKRTPACVDRILDVGIRRVVVGIQDPDDRVAGRGIARLREAGVQVDVGQCQVEIADQLAPYVVHRSTGRPFVVLKLAATLDGRTAAPDGSSQWITGPEARADAHRLRAESDAVAVGAGSVRSDDPSLTVRQVDGPDPRRVVLGVAPAGAKVHPCEQMSGDLEAILDELGAQDVVQLLVEGGATVAAEFHRRGLVDRYVVYLAPVLLGGDDGLGLFTGPGAPTLGDAFRGRILSTTPLGADLKVVLDGKAA